MNLACPTGVTMGGRGYCRAETTAIGDWRLATGKIASGNGFDHLPEVGGCEFKAGCSLLTGFRVAIES